MITFSAWVFYAGNLFVISGYVVAIILLARTRGWDELREESVPPISRPALVAVEFYLASCTVLHVELAIRAYGRQPLIENLSGEVDARIIMIVLFKAVLWVVMLLIAGAIVARRRGRRQEAAGDGTDT